MKVIMVSTFFFFCQLSYIETLRRLMVEEEELQEVDALAHLTGIMVRSRSAKLEGVAVLLAIHCSSKRDIC